VRSARELLATAGTARAARRLARLEERGEIAGARVEAEVRRILSAVRRRGDRALLAFTQRFDGVRLTRRTLRVPGETMARSYRELPAAARRDLRLAATRIRAFHRRQRERSWVMRDESGARVGQVI